MLEWMNETAGGVELRIKAVPRASKNEIQGLHDGALKVRLTTPPVDGKANQALIKFLSKQLAVSKSQIELVQGETSRLKTLRLIGITKQQILTRLRL